MLLYGITKLQATKHSISKLVRGCLSSLKEATLRPTEWFQVYDYLFYLDSSNKRSYDSHLL